MTSKRFSLVSIAAIGLLAALLAGTSCAGVATPKGWSGPTVQDGTIYLGSVHGKLVALSEENGATQWQTPLPPIANAAPGEGAAVYQVPLVSGSTVFVGTFDRKATGPFPLEALQFGRTDAGRLFAIDTVTHAAKWPKAFEAGGPIVGEAVVAGNEVIFGSSDGNLYAVDTRTGAEAWRFKANGPIWSGLAIDSDKVYFGTLDHRFYAVDLKTHQEVWHSDASGAISATPLVANGTVYFGSFDGNLYALNTKDGKSAWAAPFHTGQWFWMQPVTDGQTIYVGAMNNLLFALDAKTGAEKWAEPFKATAPFHSTPALIKGQLAVVTQDGALNIIDTATGKSVWEFKTGDQVLAPLAVSGDRVYLTTQYGKVWAFNVIERSNLWSVDTSS